VNSDFSAAPESLLTLANAELWEVLFAPGDGSMVVRTVGGAGRRDIWLVPTGGGGRLVPLLTTSANEVAPVVSPNGRWLAYVSDESGKSEVYVRPFPSGGARTQVSLEGGTEPLWSPRGDEIFYRSGAAFLAAAVRASPSGEFEVNRRTLLFSERNYAADITHTVYDVLPDGSRFVVVRRLESASYLTVTLNLFDHLGPRSATSSSSEQSLQRR
jgi:Tol biopolymer transport system component